MPLPLQTVYVVVCTCMLVFTNCEACCSTSENMEPYRSAARTQSEEHLQRDEADAQQR